MAVTSVKVRNISQTDQLISEVGLLLYPQEEQELIGLRTVEEISKSFDLAKMLALNVISVQITRDDGSVRFAHSDGFTLESEFLESDDDTGSVIIEPHAIQHLPNGGDPLATGTPVDVGTANAIGTANSFSKSDHVHDHGDLPGGALHDEATTSVAGFMSAADKTKLDLLDGRKFKSGVVLGTAFSGSPKTAAVVFSTSYTSNSYDVTVTGTVSRAWSIESKSATGFTINANAAAGFASGEVYWVSTDRGETG